MKKFKIYTVESGFYREVDIELYTTRKQMHAGILAAKKEQGESIDLEAETVGLTETRLITHFTHEDQEVTDPNVGRIFLNKKDLDIDTLAHEIHHVASNIYNYDLVKPGDTAEEHFITGRERAAYMMGELFQQAYEQLKDYITNK